MRHPESAIPHAVETSTARTRLPRAFMRDYSGNVVLRSQICSRSRWTSSGKVQTSKRSNLDFSMFRFLDFSAGCNDP